MDAQPVRLLGAAFLAAAVRLAVQARAQPRQVNGVLGGSVVLSAALPPNATVREIEWSFSAGAGATIRTAELSRGRFERPDPGDRFRQRLEMFNATSLRISALEPGDGGLYGARVKLLPAVVHDQSFNLSVFEPLPDPEIQSWLLSETPARCNVSLQCRVPSGTRGTVAWMNPRRDQRGLWVRPISGGVLKVEVQRSYANATLTCRVRSAVEERRRSIDLLHVCWSRGEAIRLGCWTTVAAAILLGPSAWRLSP
ncbi:SLAM family member 8-like [Rhea pennata]|uniref:SLAM family member 8-like n=1 Tax=Rhea pennata TaxID=8795 RepID=UPI002E258286